MTASTEQERAEFTDGAWYWVEKEGWHDEPPKIAPAMYRADCDAWYSWEFSGISTEYLKVLEPCVRHEQAARRAQVVAVPQEALALLRWAEFLLATSAPMTSQQKEAWPSLQKAADEMRAYQASMLAAAPQPPDAVIKQSLTTQEDHIGHTNQMVTVVSPWKDHLTAQLVNGLTTVVRKYHATQQLREHIGTLVRPVCERIKQLEADMGIPITQQHQQVAAPVQLPEPWGHCVGGQIFIARELPRHIKPLVESGEFLDILIYTEQQVRPLLETQKFQLDELAMLTRMLIRALRKVAPENKTAARAVDYLKRKGLTGNPLRGTFPGMQEAKNVPSPADQLCLSDAQCDRLITALCPDFSDESFPGDREVLRNLAREALATREQEKRNPEPRH